MVNQKDFVNWNPANILSPMLDLAFYFYVLFLFLLAGVFLVKSRIVLKLFMVIGLVLVLPHIGGLLWTVIDCGGVCRGRKGEVYMVLNFYRVIAFPALLLSLISLVKLNFLSRQKIAEPENTKENIL